MKKPRASHFFFHCPSLARVRVRCFDEYFSTVQSFIRTTNWLFFKKAIGVNVEPTKYNHRGPLVLKVGLHIIAYLLVWKFIFWEDISVERVSLYSLLWDAMEYTEASGYEVTVARLYSALAHPAQAVLFRNMFQSINQNCPKDLVVRWVWAT